MNLPSIHHLSFRFNSRICPKADPEILKEKRGRLVYFKLKKK